MARISLLTTPWRLPLYLCSHGKLLGGKSSLAVKGIYSRLSKQVGDRGSISLAINSIVATVKNIGLTPQIIVQTIKNMLSIVRSILSTHASIASSVNVNHEKPCVGHQKRIASTTSASPQKHVFHNWQHAIDWSQDFAGQQTFPSIAKINLSTTGICVLNFERLLCRPSKARPNSLRKHLTAPLKVHSKLYVDKCKTKLPTSDCIMSLRALRRSLKVCCFESRWGEQPGAVADNHPLAWANENHCQGKHLLRKMCQGSTSPAK